MVEEPPDHVAVGKLGRPHGIKGEIRVFLFNPRSQTLTAGLDVRIESEHQPPVDLTVERARYTDDFVIVKFEEIDDRGEVDEHKHAHALVSTDDLPELEEDDLFYEAELVGAPVYVADEEDGDVPEGAEPIGEVHHTFATGANDVMVVERDEGDDLFVPLVQHAISLLDFEHRLVVLQPLEIWAPVDYDVEEN